MAGNHLVLDLLRHSVQLEVRISKVVLNHLPSVYGSIPCVLYHRASRLGPISDVSFAHTPRQRIAPIYGFRDIKSRPLISVPPMNLKHPLSPLWIPQILRRMSRKPIHGTHSCFPPVAVSGHGVNAGLETRIVTMRSASRLEHTVDPFNSSSFHPVH